MGIELGNMHATEIENMILYRLFYTVQKLILTL